MDIESNPGVTVDNDQLLTVNEVAAQLRLNPKTIKRWIASGRLPGIWLGTDRAGWRIRSSEVASLLQGGEQTHLLPDEETKAKKLAA